MTSRGPRKAIDMAPLSVTCRPKLTVSIRRSDNEEGSTSSSHSSSHSSFDSDDMDTAQASNPSSPFHTFTAALSPAAAVLPVRTSTDIPMTPPERRTGLDISASGSTSPKPKQTDSLVGGPDLISLLTSPEAVAALGQPKYENVAGQDLISLLSAPQPVASAVAAKAAAKKGKAGAANAQSPKAYKVIVDVAASGAPASPTAAVAESASVSYGMSGGPAATAKRPARWLSPASSSDSSSSSSSGSTTSTNDAHSSGRKAAQPAAQHGKHLQSSLYHLGPSPPKPSIPKGMLPVGVAPPGGWLVLGGAGSGSRVRRFFRQRDDEVEAAQGEEGVPAARRPLRQLVYLNTVSAIPVYQDKCVEELRAEDYAAGVRCATRANPPPPATGFAYDPSLPALLAAQAQQQQGQQPLAAGPDAPPKGGWRPFAGRGNGAGSCVAMFVATQFTEEPSKLAPRNTEVQLQDITAMQTYKHQCVEELRMEDYAAGIYCATGAAPPSVALPFPVHCPLENNQPQHQTQPPAAGDARKQATAAASGRHGKLANGTKALAQATTTGTDLLHGAPDDRSASTNTKPTAKQGVAAPPPSASSPAHKQPTSTIPAAPASSAAANTPSPAATTTANPPAVTTSTSTAAAACGAGGSTPVATSTAPSTFSFAANGASTTAGTTAPAAAGKASASTPAATSAASPTASPSQPTASGASSTLAPVLVLNPDTGLYQPAEGSALVLIRLPNGFYGTPEQAAALAANGNAACDGAAPGSAQAAATAAGTAAAARPTGGARGNFPRRTVWLALRVVRALVPLLPLILYWQQQQKKQTEC